jgi:RNA polymerase II subunit A small phosphatase-like protein
MFLSSTRNSDRYRVVRLLGPQSPENSGRKCLVLDLDETLVHSSFQAVPNPDYIIPVNIDNVIHNVYVLKRPGVDEFMRRMAEVYEVVIFTASLSKYANPLLDELDMHKVISKRLFRESCVLHEGHYVKDLSLLNRDVSQCIIVDNSQMSYSFHPENAIDCFSYIDDPADVELWEIADFLENIENVKDVRYFCRYVWQ